MERGNLYLVRHTSPNDPRPQRPVVIVSRQILIDSRHSTVICATIHSDYEGAATQVLVGIDEGLKHDSSIHCDELVSLPKRLLTNYLGSLSPQKIQELNLALVIALELEDTVSSFENDNGKGNY